MGNYIFPNSTKSQGSKCDSELGSGQVGVEFFEQGFSQFGPGAAFLDFKVQLRSPDLYESKFSRDKKTIKKNKQ